MRQAVAAFFEGHCCFRRTAGGLAGRHSVPGKARASRLARKVPPKTCYGEKGHRGERGCACDLRPLRGVLSATTVNPLPSLADVTV